MSTVPVRLDADALAAKDRLTEPEPVPEIGPVAVIHESIGAASHGHPVDGQPETLAAQGPLRDGFRQPAEVFPVAVRLYRGSVHQTRIGKVLDCHVSLRVSDAQLPAVHFALTRLRLHVFPIELEPSPHMGGNYIEMRNAECPRLNPMPNGQNSMVNQ